MPSIHRTAPGQTGVSGKVNAFSLIEVVVAVGIFAIGIVAVIGLLSPTIKSVTNVTDSTIANRLADNIQLELQRVGFSNALSYFGLSSSTSNAQSSSATLIFVANRDGSRVDLAQVVGGTAPSVIPANNDTVTTTTGYPLGILNRDRYYEISVNTFPAGNALQYVGGSGFLALSVKVAWPYQVPVGAPSTTTTPGGSGDALNTNYVVVPTSQQSSMLLNMALNP